MSTDLLGIRVVATEPGKKKALLQVFVTYYETARKSHIPLPEDLSTFFMILADTSNRHFKDSPLEKEVSTEDYFKEEWVDMNAWRFISHYILKETKNHPLKKYKGMGDFYTCDGEKWQDEDKLVQGIFEVYVTDEKYIEHLKPGYAWGTTAYGTRALTYYRNPAYIAQLPDLLSPSLRLDHFRTEGENATAFFAYGLAFTPDSKVLLIYGIARGRGEGIMAIDANSGKTLWVELDSEKKMKGEGWEVHDYFILGNFHHIERVWNLSEKPQGLYNCRYPSASGKYKGDLSTKFITFLNEKGKKDWRIDQPKSISCVAYSPDEKNMALAVPDLKRIAIWDLENRCEIKNIEIPELGKRIESISYDPTGKWIVFMAGEFMDCAIFVLDAGTEEIIFRYKGRKNKYGDPKTGIRDVAWSPDGKMVAVVFYSDKKMEQDHPVSHDWVVLCPAGA